MIQVIPQLDVRESCQAAPQHSVAWRAVVASVEIAAEPVEDIAHGSPVRIVRRRHQPVKRPPGTPYPPVAFSRPRHDQLNSHNLAAPQLIGQGIPVEFRPDENQAGAALDTLRFLEGEATAHKVEKVHRFDTCEV